MPHSWGSPHCRVRLPRLQSERQALEPLWPGSMKTTMPAMLEEKKADLVTAVMPFAINPQLNQTGFALFDQTEGLGTSQFVFWAARQSFIGSAESIATSGSAIHHDSLPRN